ncbi:MAG TPA: CAP domain-containing protein, partial [Chloroflexi bacterium]|nr:CAP domain-containing protein [Chloroflexota bacterium]
LQRGWGSHYGSDGSNVKTRMERAGYYPVRWSECWAQTQSPQKAIDFWMDEVPPNDPHRRTILSTWLTEVGVGVVDPEWGYYIFANFGQPRE